MFVANRKELFSRLIMKRIGVELGTGAEGHFEGVGIVLASCPDIPNSLMLLYPTFYAPNDSTCTITNGGLKKYAGFEKVLIDTHVQMTLIRNSGQTYSIPFITEHSIDYIKLDVRIPTRQSRSRLNYRHMSLQPASITSKPLRGTVLQSMWLHELYGHRSIAALQQMVDKGIIKGRGLPCKLAPLPGNCPICIAAGATKIPRGSLTDRTEPPLGTRWHIDFTFFNTISRRGFSSALIIVEATSRYIWFFPCRNKKAPIDLCLFFFNQMQRQGLPVIRCRSDEDGALINSTEFCKMMHKSLGITLESTGGYESSINGTAESPNRTTKRCIRANLMGSRLPDPFWCFAGQHSAVIYNQCLHRMTQKVPAKVFTGRTIPTSKLHPFGCQARIVKNLPAQRALSARTAGDPRSYDAEAASLSDVQVQDDEIGRFVGFSNHPNVALIYVKDKNGNERIRRAHHVIFDHYGLTTRSNYQPLPHEQLLRTFHDHTFGQASATDGSSQKSSSLGIEESQLDFIDSPFDPDECETFQVILPPKGQSIGITVVTDEDYTVPILHTISPSSNLYDEIPLRHNFASSWVVQIEEEHPITAQGVKDTLYALQRSTPRKIEITLCNMSDPVRYHHQSYRAIFDSCTALRHAHMATLSEPPACHNSIFKCLDSEHREHWIQACYSQFEKNDDINLCTQPTPIEDVPKDTKILRTVMSTKVKKKGENLYQFIARMCADGSGQEKGIDFEFSFSATTSAPAVRITLTYAAAFGLTLAIIDVVNAFQSTMLKHADRLTIAMPPFYKQWFEKKYPRHKLRQSPSGKYVLQLLKGLQGDKSIGRKWYLLLQSVLEAYGFISCLSEPALYVYENGDMKALLNTSTDDLLLAFTHDSIFQGLCEHLQRYFDITTKTGVILKYLNLQIIQTSYGISYDQTEHIEDKVLKKYFPADKIADSHPKRVHTPFRTDSQFEIDLLEQLPATGKELKALVARYGDTYAGILGSIMHPYVWTRPDLGFAVTRLSKYTHAPNAAAFAGLYRILRYFYTHPHRPIIVPRKKIDGYHTLRVDFDKPKFKAIQLPNGLIILVDSDHARDVVSRRSCHCILALILGVLVHWKIAQDKCVAIHSTDSEIRGAFAASKQAIYLQEIAEFIGIDREHCRPLTIFEDSQPCIDVLKANTVTSRVKHIAVPIHFIHQLISQGRIDILKIDTNLNLADSGTKPNSAPVHFRQFDQAIGVRFYPPPESEHYKLLKLDKFVKSPYDN